MRKALLFTFLCFSGSILAQVQPQLTDQQHRFQSFTKGTWLVGIQGGYSAGLVLAKNLALQTNSGYFIINQVLIGLSAGRNQDSFEDFRATLYSLGPLVRLQLTKTRISPFLTASYQAGRSTYWGGQVFISSPNIGIYYPPSASAQTVYSRSFGAGLSIGIIPALRLDLLLNWQDKVSSIGSEIRASNGLYQFQFGANYAFGHRL